jgi:hypothetical protein
MKFRSLRKFLFLDTDTVTDYLAALEGSVLAGTIEETQQETHKKEGGADVKVVRAGAGSEDSTQTRRERVINPAAQFQRLYELLESEDAIRFLESFDEEIWSQLKRDEILEIQADIRLPEMLVLARGVKELPSLMDAFEPFKEFLDTGDQTFDEIQSQANMMSAFGDLANTKEVPILFEAIGAPYFHFAARLPRRYLMCDTLDLQGEAVVFGKVQRLVQRDQSETVFSLDRGLDALTAQLNRKQRRALAKKSSKDLVEVLKGPGLILLPIAVYR